MEFKGLPNGINFILIDLWVGELLLIDKVSSLFCMFNLIQNTFGVKKARPSKVESYLEVNT